MAIKRQLQSDEKQHEKKHLLEWESKKMTDDWLIYRKLHFINILISLVINWLISDKHFKWCDKEKYKKIKIMPLKNREIRIIFSQIILLNFDHVLIFQTNLLCTSVAGPSTFFFPFFILLMFYLCFTKLCKQRAKTERRRLCWKWLSQFLKFMYSTVKSQ